ncbi:hypothetical protein VPNG_02969 [Cytospora leucostoma]|uniref:BZIP domain-containing protein n=1 Tax=Cytospora leucostoma TaxID=1230097 RepID=A0A423XGD3_9PEZI|nr:hypothetical protein VPNG_02969 [Cytospora leucostoma]
MSNMDSSINTRTPGSHSDGCDIKEQHQPQPESCNTAASNMAAIASASYQSDAYTTNQRQDIHVDLTSLDDTRDTESTLPMFANNQYLADNSKPIKSIEEVVPKFDPEAPEPQSFEFASGNGIPMLNAHQPFGIQTITKFESQPPEPANTRMDIYQIPQYTFTHTFPEASSPAQTNNIAQAYTPAPRATPASLTPRYSRGVTAAPQEIAESILPNRIAEPGPITHPDRDWRPYSTNHWHVFISTPDTLKYLSTAEIKEIRDHCYELSKALDEDGNPTTEPVPIPETVFTTADAQAVWRHCDAYIRRRGQLRNNNAARRSRQKREAETRYWRRKALEYGCPDHEFVWDERDVTPGPSANAYASARPPVAAEPAATAASFPRTHARASQRRSERVRHQRQGSASVARGESVATDEVATGLD